MHFGLGDAESVDRLEIIWPGGHVDTLRDLDINQIITIEEGGSVLARVPVRRN